MPRAAPALGAYPGYAIRRKRESVEHRTLGASGLFVSEVGLGCNNFGGKLDQEATRAVVQAALEAGIDFFDTADMYGGGLSEEFLGKALGARRGDVVVATKCGLPMGDGPHLRGASRRYIIQALEKSLRRLGTDYVDLYQIHLPDPHTPIGETLRALDDCIRAGKVRYAGCSNFSGWQIADAQWSARQESLNPLVSAQNHLSLLERDALKEVIPACERFGLGMLPYFPLASGLLTGKYRRGEPPPEGTRLSAERFARRLSERNFDRVEALAAFAGQRGRSLLELAFGWLLSLPAVSCVIAGATTPEQVRGNVAAAGMRLDADAMASLDACLQSAESRYQEMAA